MAFLEHYVSKASITLADVKINALVVSQGIMKYIQDSTLTTSANYKDPSKFDPNASNIDKWFQASVQSLQQDVGRLTVGLYFDGSLLVECFARTQAGLLAHLAMATEIQDVLCQTLIPIHDYQESGNPLIGYCSVKEPSIKTREQGGAYQKATLSIRFRVEQIV